MKGQAAGKRAVLILVVSIVVGIVVEIVERQQAAAGLASLVRNQTGKGTWSEELEVYVEGEPEGLKVQVEVEETEYPSDKMQEIFREAIKELEQRILGSNESFDYVDSNLDLITKIPDTGISVEWELNRYDLMDAQGRIKSDYLMEAGNLIELKGYLRYQEEEALFVTNAVLYPPQKDQGQKLEEAIKNQIKEINKTTKESKKLLLPDSVDEKKLSWQKTRSNLSGFCFLMGIAGAIYFIAAEKQKQQQKLKKRQEQMHLDYPEILNKFVLLLGAGMTTKNAWRKMVRYYQENKKRTGIRYAYEEMSYTYRELESKVMESECYERFGKRCQLQCYIKFGALLSQNLQKGSAGLAKMLHGEAIQSFEERKNQARRKGEEAGVKLLGPMFVMLLVVLIIIIFPAFFSFDAF